MKKITISICFVAALFAFPHAALAQFLVVSLSTPAPAVADITVWKAMHSAYQQRSAVQK